VIDPALHARIQLREGDPTRLVVVHISLQPAGEIDRVAPHDQAVGRVDDEAQQGGPQRVGNTWDVLPCAISSSTAVPAITPAPIGRAAASGEAHQRLPPVVPTCTRRPRRCLALRSR
jgi:hypothetical protein